MKDTRVAKRYAAALFEVAKRSDILDSVAEDLLTIERILSDSAILRSALTEPLMAEERKERLVGDAFGDRITATTLNFLKLLIRKRRAELLDVTFREFRILSDEHNNIVSATASTAVPLTPDQLTRLTKGLEKLTGKHIILTATVDPGIIAGVVVRIGDRIVDGSVMGRLHRLEQHLLGNRTLGGAI
ncbi:MAG: F0F1 ATP synthase subunit delta [Capsulimonadaceae bacterium]